MISVIVPAHNEGQVIERCLGALTDGAQPTELEVIVVCNGCSDDTESRAQVFGGPVRVIATPVASKPHALNLGEAAAQGFPRFYVDADVLLTFDAIREIARTLEDGPVLAAAPRAVVELRGASWAVRAFYRVWTQLPYYEESMIGAGVCAVSEEGRKRFDRFPDIIADDEFLRRQFAPAERQRVHSCTCTVFSPLRLSGLVNVKTRSRLGLYQLESRYPSLKGNAGNRLGRAMIALLTRPSLWPSVPVYVLVGLLTRLRASKRVALREFAAWDRDDSSRVRRIV